MAGFGKLSQRVGQRRVVDAPGDRLHLLGDIGWYVAFRSSLGWLNKLIRADLDIDSVEFKPVCARQGACQRRLEIANPRGQGAIGDMQAQPRAAESGGMDLVAEPGR